MSFQRRASGRNDMQPPAVKGAVLPMVWKYDVADVRIEAWVGRASVRRLMPPRPLRTTRLYLIISLLFLSIRPLAPDPSRHLPAQSGAPLCARALPVHQSTAHRGGGVPSVKSYVAVCSNPPVHGGRRASSHWLLLAPTPTDPRVGLRSSFQAHGFLPSTTQTNVVSAEGGWAKRYATPCTVRGVVVANGLETCGGRCSN